MIDIWVVEANLMRHTGHERPATCLEPRTFPKTIHNPSLSTCAHRTTINMSPNNNRIMWSATEIQCNSHSSRNETPNQIITNHHHWPGKKKIHEQKKTNPCLVLLRSILVGLQPFRTCQIHDLHLGAEDSFQGDHHWFADLIFGNGIKNLPSFNNRSQGKE